MHRCQNLDCAHLEYFDVERPDRLFMNCAKLNELSLLWHDVIMTSFLNITHQLLAPLEMLSYFKATPTRRHKNNTLQCSPVTCLSNCTTCNIINDAYDIYDKACTVEMECMDGTKNKDSYDTRMLINSSKEQCDNESTIDLQYILLVITGKRISIALCLI